MSKTELTTAVLRQLAFQGHRFSVGKTAFQQMLRQLNIHLPKNEVEALLHTMFRSYLKIDNELKSES